MISLIRCGTSTSCLWPAYNYLDEPYRNPKGLPETLDFSEGIPGILEQDVVFSAYTCSITFDPLLDPVFSPFTHDWYDKTIIEKWINKHHDCPQTRRPLYKQDLHQMPELKKLLKSRCDHYKTTGMISKDTLINSRLSYKPLPPLTFSKKLMMKEQLLFKTGVKL